MKDMYQFLLSESGRGLIHITYQIPYPVSSADPFGIFQEGNCSVVNGSLQIQNVAALRSPGGLCVF